METSRISQACSDASYLRIMLGGLIAFTFLAFFPFLGLVGLAVGFVFVKYAVPVLVIRWWIRNAKIQTSEPDFGKAKRTVWFISGISLFVLLFVRISFFGLRL